ERQWKCNPYFLEWRISHPYCGFTKNSNSIDSLKRFRVTTNRRLLPLRNVRSRVGCGGDELV
ncbi:MAG: hypothetical protein M3Q50_06585, partial [Chloroflexota bacterium]|nr:hypothetical protein [Chloroflexota bacterium]